MGVACPYSLAPALVDYHLFGTQQTFSFKLLCPKALNHTSIVMRGFFALQVKQNRIMGLGDD